MIGGRLATLIEGMQDYLDRKMEVKFKIGKKSKGKGGSRKKKASHLRISVVTIKLRRLGVSMSDFDV